MSGLLTPDDLSTYMGGVSFNASQWQAAQQTLNGAQSALEAYLNRPIGKTLIQERVQANEDGVLQLSAKPVHLVIGVWDQHGTFIDVSTTNGVHADAPIVPALVENEFVAFNAQAQVDYIGDTFYGDTILDYTGIAVVRVPNYSSVSVGGGIGGCGWNWGYAVPSPWYVVKYVGGYIGIDLDDMKLGILRVAAREMTNNHDDTRSLWGGTYEAPTGNLIEGDAKLGWSEDELKRFEGSRRITVT